MNVFIVGSPLETAMELDRVRLNKQIVECTQMLNALNGETKAWRNHPCTLQYQDHKAWLIEYQECLKAVYTKQFAKALFHSEVADEIRPDFHTEEFFNQMKRRLYTKDKKFYSQWAHLGTSEVNWYFVNGEWRYYKNGKQVKESV